MGAAIVGLVMAVILSALTVIYSSYLYRLHFNKQQLLVKEWDALEVEWGQLLLEQSALAAHSRIESEVGRHLDMYVPGPEEIIVVEP
jgi:cell division protein FtsL